MVTFNLNKKVITKYLVSFLLVFIIPSVFIMLFFNFYTSKLIYNQSEERLIGKFSNSIGDIELRLENIQNTFSQLSINEDTLSGIPLSTEYDDIITIKRFTKRLSEYRMANNLIKDISVYYNKNDVLINDQGLFPFNYSHARYYKNIGISTELFRDSINRRKDFYVIPDLRSVSENEANKRGVILVQSFPIGDDSPYGSMIMKLDRKLLMGSALSNMEQSNESLLIIDRDGNTIAGINANNMTKAALADMVKNNNSLSGYIKIGDRKYFDILKKSDITNLWYLYLLPEESIKGTISDFSNIMLKILIVYIILGLLISLFFSISFYRPVGNIIDEIANKNGNKLAVDKPQKGINEFSVIRNYISALSNEKESLASKINIYMNDIKNGHLLELITEECSPERFNQISDMLDLKFTGRYFCVIYIVLVDGDKINVDQVNKTLIIQDAIDGMLAKHGNGYKVSLEKDRIGIILNVNENITLYDIVQEYAGLLEFLRNNYGAEIKIGIGNLYDGYERLVNSYSEALETVKYCIMYGFDVLSYSKMSDIVKNVYYLPISIENKLLNFVEVGDIDNATQTLMDIFRKNFIEERLELKAVYKFYSHMLSIIEKVEEKYGIEVSDMEKAGKNYLDTNAMNTINVITGRITYLYDSVCNYIKSQKDNPNDILFKEIERFISDNYCSSLLSCSSVADKFNISQPYLSLIMKKYVGMNYGDYVNNLRIKTAKKLLKENKLNINEIAEKLGYGSGNSFIRTFRCIEGITPRQYSNFINED